MNRYLYRNHQGSYKVSQNATSEFTTSFGFRDSCSGTSVLGLGCRGSGFGVRVEGF